MKNATCLKLRALVFGAPGFGVYDRNPSLYAR